jgi:hypothetical protein
MVIVRLITVIMVKIMFNLKELLKTTFTRKYPSNGTRKMSCGLLHYDGVYTLSGIPRRKK